MSSSLYQKLDHVKMKRLLNVMHDNYPWICQGFVHQQFQTISEKKRKRINKCIWIKIKFPYLNIEYNYRN